jgi:hypothetical protein
MRRNIISWRGEGKIIYMPKIWIAQEEDNIG